MIKNILILFLVLLTFTFWGQNKIVNPLNADYKNIKGTKISLIPPKGFEDAKNFLGIQKTESGASIMIVEIPGPYSETSKGFTKEKMLSQGITVSKIENTTINDLPAIFVTATQNAHGSTYTKFILFFGNEKESIMLNGVFPEILKELGEKIKKSMFSAYYEENMVLDPFASLDYKIDVKDTKLKFAKSMSNSLIFTIDGLLPTASEDKTNLIVSKSISPISQEDKKQFAVNRIHQLPLQIEKIEYNKDININGLNGYEIFAKAKNKKTAVTENIYYVILFTDNLYYILFGTTNDDSDVSIGEIKKAILTFKRK